MKWYVWLSGSSGGIIVPKNAETNSINKNANNKIIKLLSNKSAFLSLLKLKLIFSGFVFLKTKNNMLIIKFKIVKIMTLNSLIALNKDKISIFSTIRAKKAINIIRKLPNKLAIK